MLNPDWTQQAVVSMWEGNWRAAVENGYDSGHASYVHRNSFRWRTAGSCSQRGRAMRGSRWWVRICGRSGGSLVCPRPTIPASATGPATAGCAASWPRSAPSRVGRGRIPNEFRLPCMIHNKYFYYTHIRWAVPVDEHHTRNFQVYAGQYEGLRSLAFRTHYWLWHRWVFHMLFNGQDESIVEALDYEGHERLYRPDGSITGSAPVHRGQRAKWRSGGS